MMRFLKIIIGFIPLLVVAQTGPGGVGNTSDNGLWLDASTITVANGAPIPLWSDTSGNNNNAFQLTVASQPSFVASSFNNYPAINFNGTSAWLEVADAPILDGTSSINYFAIMRPRSFNSPSAVQSIVSKRQAPNASAANYSYSFFFWNSNLTLDIVTANNRFDDGAITFNTGDDYILSFGFDGSKSGGLRSTISRNGMALVTGNESSTILPDSSFPVTIGKLNVVDTRYLNAEMAEIIHFNRELNETETNIVNNYLSAKYDIPIDPSVDFYTQDEFANGDFDHDVAGIGRASSASVPQQHIDSQGTGIVRMSIPNLSRGDYLFWGRNMMSNTVPTFIDNISDNNSILNTSWRVSDVGSVGSDITFQIDLTGIHNPSNCIDYNLVIDNDSDFSSPLTNQPLTLIGNIATATNLIGFDDGDYFTITRNDKIIYDGTNWFNGSGPGNEPDMTDSCKDLLVLAGNTTLINDFHVNSITIDTGSRLNIGPGSGAGALVTVENELNLQNGSRLNLRANSQLVQNHPGADINTGDGFLIARQEGTGIGFNYNYWSSPVNRGGSWTLNNLRPRNGPPVQWTAQSVGDPDPSTSPITLSSRWLYAFNAANGNYDQWSYIGINTPVLPGFGYTMKGSGTGTDTEYRFVGTPNNGDITLNVIAGGFALIGNPYPSALDIDQFLSDNAATTTATAYFYEQFASNSVHNLASYQGGYATRNMMMGVAAVADASGLTSGIGAASKPAPDQYTAVAQGFFMEATGSTISFNNSHRAAVRETVALGGGSVFYAAPGSPSPIYGGDLRTKITFAFEKPQVHKQYLGLGYDSRASYGVDNGFDAIDFNTSSDMVQWNINSDKYIIQSLQNVNYNDILPLFVNIDNPGIYELSIDIGENIPAGMEVYLYDAVDQVEYPLHIQTAILNLPILDDNSTRYSIRFQPTNTLSIIDTGLERLGISYINSIKTLELYNPTGKTINKARIYGMSGRLIKQINDPEFQTYLLLNSGIYLVQLTMENDMQVTRKIIVQ